MSPEVLSVLSAHPHWVQVRLVLSQLQSSGFQAFLAGGCVRDALLRRQPKDFDVATNALPDQVETLFSHTVGVGKAFGVILVVVDGVEIEVATFRRDGVYLDGRHPESVSFTSAREDALRRDFTINALFYDFAQNQVVDFVDGLRDLEEGLIQAVGDPLQRFSEDALRPLRALRFSSQLGFSLEPRTFSAMARCCEQVAGVARERITAELEKILCSSHPLHGINGLLQTGMWELVWPWLPRPSNDPDGLKLWVETKRLLISHHPRSSFDLYLLLLMLFGIRSHSGPELNTLLRQLGKWPLSKRSFQNLSWVLNMWKDYSQCRMPLEEDVLGELLSRLEHAASGLFRDLVGCLSGLESHWEALGEQLDSALAAIDGHYGAWPSPLLRGEDLLELGFEPGPQMGAVLSELRKAQLLLKIKSRAEALNFCRSMK